MGKAATKGNTRSAERSTKRVIVASLRFPSRCVSARRNECTTFSSPLPHAFTLVNDGFFDRLLSSFEPRAGQPSGTRYCSKRTGSFVVTGTRSCVGLGRVRTQNPKRNEINGRRLLRLPL